MGFGSLYTTIVFGNVRSEFFYLCGCLNDTLGLGMGIGRLKGFGM